MKQQKKPSLAKMISTMYRVYSQHMTTKIKPYDLNMTDFSIIMGLHATPGASLNSFSHEKKINKAILSKALKKLKAKGLVRLERDADHKQKYKIYITEDARKIVPTYKRYLRKCESDTLQRLIPSEKETLLTLLAKVYDQDL